MAGGRDTRTSPHVAGRPAEHPPDRRVSYNQEQICLLNAFYPNNQAYNAQATVHLKGHLDLGCLEDAVSLVIRRHEILRTSIVLAGDGYRAVVHDPFQFTIPCEDLRELPGPDRPGALDRLIVERTDRVFDVGKLPLLSIDAVRLDTDRWSLIHVEHHVVHDGWSFGRFWREAQAAYNALVSDEDPDLPPVPAQYQQFVGWQRSRMEGAYGEVAGEFWRKYLEGAAGEVSVGKAQGTESRLDGHSVETELPAERFSEVCDAARRLACSPFVLLFSVFARLLAMESGETDFTVGTAVNARTEPDLEAMLGMVVNTMPVRVVAREGEPLADTVRSVQTSFFEALRYHDVPLSLVVRTRKVTQKPGRNPVFQHCFSFHDSEVPRIDLKGATGHIHEELSETAKFEINTIVVPPATERSTNSARVLWQFARSAFTRAEAVRFTRDYDELLERILREL